MQYNAPLKKAIYKSTEKSRLGPRKKHIKYMLNTYGFIERITRPKTKTASVSEAVSNIIQNY